MIRGGTTATDPRSSRRNPVMIVTAVPSGREEIA
jgi:hypothetical protein